ncbi:site-specific integrase [Pseudomonas aeruginosa]|uniref:site-specific integrase n=1 Tax=Pseudomonas aeruginosa TaxID=287 RepID=UPI00249742B6|nr:site-specific integrase [Pseudomonas aeruginosa]MDI2410860.1 site-specific integrase [Pseudomonas aeruginosa]
MAHNLELQGGTYHVRLAIPTDVQRAFGGRRVLSKSLKTGVRREAMELRLPILAAWKAQIKLARESQFPPEGWQEKLRNELITLDEERKAAKLRTIGENTAPLEISRQDLERFQRENPELMEVIDRHSDENPDWGIQPNLNFQDRIYQAVRLCIEFDLHNSYKLSEEQIKELEEISKDPQSYKPKSPITKARLEKFREFRTNRNIQERTIDQQSSKLKKLSEHLTKTGNPLDFDTVSSWLDTLSLTSKTLAQYLLAGSVFWKWAMKYDERWRVDYKGKANPFEGHDLPMLRGAERNSSLRKDFALSDIKKIHAEALRCGHTVLADIILLGLYTGARIEEICQLRKENIIKIDKISCIDITDSKTAAGIRTVPIHPIIKETIDRLVKDSTDDFLIKSNSRSKYGIRSDPFVKSFGRLKTSLGFGQDRVFHSIRKTVITQLYRANVPATLIAELVGHETGTVTFDVYSQGASTTQKMKAISKIPKLP